MLTLKTTLYLGAMLSGLLIFQLIAQSVAAGQPPLEVAGPADAPANDAFQRTWSRTDKPVADGQSDRTWMWGPEANTTGIQEPYANAPGGTRLVQYYDKSRMEITNPGGDPNAIWYVTNGLLVVEMVTGQLQIGDSSFETHSPAQVNVAGDADDAAGPTYATFTNLRDAAPYNGGATIVRRVNRSGSVSDDASLAQYGATAAHRVQVPGIDHQVASPFWAFMNSSGTVYENGSFRAGALFVDPFYATGYPISEAYWANVKVAGTVKNVLIQCFERRCLTYTPGNPAGWQVEAGNVGQHYYEWRHGAGADRKVSQSIRAAEGGTVTLNGFVSVSIPPHALANDATITIEAAQLDSAHVLLGIDSGSPGRFVHIESGGVELQSSVTLAFNVTSEMLYEGTATVVHYNDESQSWESLSASLNASSDIATIVVQHFSLYGIPSVDDMAKQWIDENIGINWQWLLGIPKAIECNSNPSSISVDNNTLWFIDECITNANDPQHPTIRVQNISLWRLEVVSQEQYGVTRTKLRKGEAKSFTLNASKGYPIEIYFRLADDADKWFLAELILSVLPIKGLGSFITDSNLQPVVEAFISNLGDQYQNRINALVSAMNTNDLAGILVGLYNVILQPDVIDAMYRALKQTNAGQDVFDDWEWLPIGIARAAVKAILRILIGGIGIFISAFIGGVSFLQMLSTNFYRLYHGRTINLTVNGPNPPARPSSPSNLQANALDQSRIQLSWQDESDNEDGFNIYGSAGTFVGQAGVNQTSYVVTGLGPGERHCYKVEAYNGAGSSARTSEACATTQAAKPTAPSNLTAVATGTSTIRLDWRDNSNNETGFVIWDGNIEVARVGTNVKSYNVGGMTPGQYRCFVIWAYNSGGTSSTTDWACATTQSEGTRPAAPSNLEVLALEDSAENEIQLWWSDNSNNEDGWNIYLSGGGFEDYLVPDVDPAHPCAPDACFVGPLAAGTYYCFTVSAYNEYGESARSNTACDTTFGGGEPPSAPQGLYIGFDNSQEAYFLAWTDTSNDEDGFEVWGGTYESGFIDTYLDTIVANGWFHWLEWGGVDIAYDCYSVRAFNAYGYSGWSNVVCWDAEPQDTIMTQERAGPQSPTSSNSRHTDSQDSRNTHPQDDMLNEGR